MIIFFPLLSTILLASFVQASSVGDNLPGTISLKPQSTHAASDLVKEGKSISSDEADALSLKLDISLLEPKSGNDIYPGKVGASSALAIDTKNAFTYLDDSPALVGRYPFTVTQSSEGKERQYTVVVGATVRNVLYHKALLEKLGYNIPPAKWIANLDLKFDNTITKDRFIRSAYDDTMKDPARWIKVVNDQEVKVQDAIVFERNQSKMYNLSLGFLPEATIGDRRVLRSLAIVYELLNIPENANLLHWNFSAVLSDHIALSFDYAREFFGNYEDSRWIARKIALLTRKDIREIVAAGNAPVEVQALLVEKLVSRRNDLIRLFKIKAADIPFDSKVSLGNGLKNGQLAAGKWPGFGSIFSTGPNPNSPFTSEQMVPFLQSKGLANLIGNAVSYFNSNVIPQANIATPILKKQVDALVTQFIEYIKTGNIQKIPLQAFFVPMPQGNIIASRDVVIGSYMGTDNKVQLADTVGINLSMGAYIGVLGVSAPWQVSGGVKGSITRTYSHLRPISNIKTALKYPFKNAIVPYFQLSLANLIDGLSEFKEGDDNAKLTTAYADVISQLKEQLQINESLIVSDSIGPSFHATVVNPIGVSTQLFAEFSSNLTLLSRVHITRTAADEIQIYRDVGNSAGISVVTGIQEYVPILTLSFDSSVGTAKAKLYKININPNLEVNKDGVASLKALKQVLTWQDFEAISYLQKPIVFESQFSQDHVGLNLLFLQSGFLQSDLKIQAIRKRNDKKEKIDMLHFNSQKMFGTNYQSFFLSLINAGISQRTGNQTYGLSSAGNGRAADSVYGSSVVHQTSMDGILNNGKLESPFISLTSDWAGWSLGKDEAEDILGQIAKIMNKKMFPPQILQNVKEIQLYDLNFYINIYGPGIEFFRSLSLAQVHKILDPRDTATNSLFPFKDGIGQNDMDVLFTELDPLILRLKEGESISDDSHNLMKIAELVELSLGYHRLAKLFGGEKNVIAGANIRGFRDGTDDASEPIIANTVGEFGSRQLNGPVEAVRGNLGANPSEFYLKWILGNL